MDKPDLEIIVIGDIEMGAGNLTDDFNADRTLSKLILELANRPHPIDLVLNGDTFDFLKCPSKLAPQSEYPRHITKEVSLAKLRLMHKAHTRVFDAWKKFASKKGKTIYFILGNHDHDLVHKDVQQEIKRILKYKDSIKFPGLSYKKHSVYVEHGQQYDFIFKVNFEKLFVNHKGKPILNFPWISYSFLGNVMRFKEQHPFMERIYPRPALLSHHKVVARKWNKHTFKYFFKSLAYYPFRYYSDPTYTFPTNLIREFYKRVRTVHWDVDNITAIFKKKKKVKYAITVLGHIHEKRIAKGRKRVIIHPGSWRDEYDFDPKTRELNLRDKRYVDIKIHDGKPTYELVDIPNKRAPFDFDEVIKDELKYIKLAAKAEGYKLYF